LWQLVSNLGGQLDDRLRAQATVEVVVERNFRQIPEVELGIVVSMNHFFSHTTEPSRIFAELTAPAGKDLQAAM
ncbi:hypothetical protein BZG21_41880, partial [Escherichia coli]|nr:hypothetical protein [Escherichia coli]